MPVTPDEDRPASPLDLDLDLDVDGDQEEMTSVMSVDQRKLLQRAAAKEAETLERDTARPPPPAEAVQAVVIPKTASLPTPAILADDEPPVSRVRPSEPAGLAGAPAPAAAMPARPASARSAAASAKASPAAGGEFSTAAIMPFVLLALAVAAALRM
jgi:hypothetical protein